MLDAVQLAQDFQECCRALWFLPLSVVGQIPGAGGTLVTVNEWGQVQRGMGIGRERACLFGACWCLCD